MTAQPCSWPGQSTAGPRSPCFGLEVLSLLLRIAMSCWFSGTGKENHTVVGAVLRPFTAPEVLVRGH